MESIRLWYISLIPWYIHVCIPWYIHLDIFLQFSYTDSIACKLLFGIYRSLWEDIYPGFYWLANIQSLITGEKNSVKIFMSVKLFLKLCTTQISSEADSSSTTWWRTWTFSGACTKHVLLGSYLRNNVANLFGRILIQKLYSLLYNYYIII